MKIKIGVIGNGKLAANCMNVMLSNDNAEIVFAIYQPSKDPMKAVPDFCSKNNIDCRTFPKLNSSETLEFIRSKEADLIFSINNFRIIGSDILSLPNTRIINFHNGPLPFYGGVNIPSWVILNGEKEHGVTWHFVNEGIDTGDIIAKSMFEIDEDTTAARLMSMSINEGYKLFKEIFPAIVSNDIKSVPQQGNSLYFSLKDMPECNGIIDFSWSYEKISRFVRALNFFPFTNDFTYARIMVNGKTLILNEISRVEHQMPNAFIGEVIKLTDSEFYIKCSDSIVSIDSLLDDDLNELTPIEAGVYLGISEGFKL